MTKSGGEKYSHDMTNECATVIYRKYLEITVLLIKDENKCTWVLNRK